jgi:hypothetical protein
MVGRERITQMKSVQHIQFTFAALDNGSVYRLELLARLKSVQSENAISHVEWTRLEPHFRMVGEYPSACDGNDV